MSDDNSMDFLIDSDKKKDLVTTIVTAYKNGLSPVPPMVDGSKRPYPSVWEPFQEKQPTEAELDDLFGHNMLTGIGYVCGVASGNLEVLSFKGDIYGEFSTEAFMADLLDDLDRIEKGYSERSPHGIHLYYRCSVIGDSMKLATCPKLPEEMKHANDTTKTLIEIHGECGYVIAAPSYGKVNSAGEYAFLSGGPDTIVTITPECHRRAESVIFVAS